MCKLGGDLQRECFLVFVSSGIWAVIQVLRPRERMVFDWEYEYELDYSVV